MFKKQLIHMNTQMTFGNPGFNSLDAGESQIDTVDGGRWGSYANGNNPSELAMTLKEIVRGKQIALMIYNWQCELPQETGDGIGFPVGFGDWWRI